MNDPLPPKPSGVATLASIAASIGAILATLHVVLIFAVPGYGTPNRLAHYAGVAAACALVAIGLRRGPWGLIAVASALVSIVCFLLKAP